MSDGDRGGTDAQQPETNEAAAVSQWPLGDIEPELQNLRAAAGLLAASPHQIESEELVSLAGQIIAHHDRLKALWRQAFDERRREHEAHEAALTAVKKARAVPGSQADLEHVGGLWGLLTAAAQVKMVVFHTWLVTPRMDENTGMNSRVRHGVRALKLGLLLRTPVAAAPGLA
jgi:hypothetical protein